ncbi:MAG: hypothetical protein ACLQOZ_07395 [Acidimicrobiales bacterium]
MSVPFSPPDLLHGTVKVEEQAIELADGSTIFGPTKTEAGVLTMTLPGEPWTPSAPARTPRRADPDALVVTSPRGGPFRRTKFRSVWLGA